MDMSLRARFLNLGSQSLSPGHGFRSEVWHSLTITLLEGQLGHYSGLEGPGKPLLAVPPIHPTILVLGFWGGGQKEKGILGEAPCGC